MLLVTPPKRSIDTTNSDEGQTENISVQNSLSSELMKIMNLLIETMSEALPEVPLIGSATVT